MEKLKSELKSMFTEHWKYLTLNAASELKLFDKIFDGLNTAEKLSKENNWDYNTLLALLKFLVSSEYLEIKEDNIYCVSEKGNLLREKNPNGLYYASLIWAGEHLNAWQKLSYTIKTGTSAFNYIYHQNYFEYLNNYPEKLLQYHKAMYEYAMDDYKDLPTVIDFGKYHSIMDVGGGYGAALSLIKQKKSNVKCFLFDLKSVIENVSNDKLEKIEGDFFKIIPNIAEAILLSRILHDWNNENASLILQNCFEALPVNGNLFVIENCTDKTPVDLSLLSLNMTVMCQSFERSSEEYISLCEKAGFTFQSDKQLNQLQRILIFIK